MPPQDTIFVLPTLSRVLGAIAGISGFLGVAFGAFGAHALRARITPELLAAYNTGVLYHLVHTLALLGVACLAALLPGKALLCWAGVGFTVGIVLFSGSLYAMALTQVRALGAITPLGGLAFLAGWLCLTVAIVAGSAATP